MQPCTHIIWHENEINKKIIEKAFKYNNLTINKSQIIRSI